MKKQLIQVLWGIANGQPQQQGEKTVYPAIREQLSAIKALMSIEEWEEEEVPMESRIASTESRTTPTEIIKTSTDNIEIAEEQMINATENKTAATKNTTTPTKCKDTSVELSVELSKKPSIVPKQRPKPKKRRFIDFLEAPESFLHLRVR